MRAVSADVVEGADLPVRPLHDEAAAAEELESQVVAGFLQLAHVADDLPTGQKQALLLQLVKLLARIDPGRQRQANRRVGGDLRRRRAAARGCRRLDARREPGKDAAEIGAALAARSFAVEVVALEKDPLPLLVDEAHQALGHGLGIRPQSVAARGDKALAEVYDHPAPGRIALAADALVVAASLGLGEERIPDGDLVGVAQGPAEARVDDAEERAQVVVARLLHHARHGAGEFLGHLAERREQQRFLAAEMEVDRSGGVSRGARNLGGGQLRKAVLRNRGDGRLDEVQLGAGWTKLGALLEVRCHESSPSAALHILSRQEPIHSMTV